MDHSLERLRPACRGADDRSVLGRGHGHSCSFAQFAGMQRDFLISNGFVRFEPCSIFWITLDLIEFLSVTEFQV